MALTSTRTGTVYPSGDQVADSSTTGTMTTSQVDDRLAKHRATVVRDDTGVLAGPRPRASFLATMSLILGLAAVLLVFTGLLAGPGVGLGLLAAFASIGGISATSRRHVAGKGDALLGLALGLAAIVIGTLLLTGNLPWLTGDTDQVARVRDWLDARVPWMFPSV